MGYLNDDLIKQARDFLKSQVSSIHETERNPVLIIYHGDGDGCTSAYFIKNFIKQKRVIEPVLYWVPTTDFDFKKTEDFLSNHEPGLVIFLDMPVLNNIEMLIKLRKSTPIFIYDHHRTEQVSLFQNDSKLLYINPIIHQSGKAYPTSLFSYELLEMKETTDKELLYMALFTESWLDRIALFKEFDKDHKDNLKKIAKRIHSSFLIQDMNTTHYAMNLLNKINNKSIIDYMDTKEYTILNNIYSLILNEKRWLMKKLVDEISKIEKPSFIMKRIESKIRLCGIIASELRWRYPGLIIGIWQKWKDRYYCELRRGKYSRIDLALLVSQLKKRIELITGGGHPEAAAFTAKREEFFKALEKMKQML